MGAARAGEFDSVTQVCIMYRLAKESCIDYMMLASKAVASDTDPRA